MLPNRARNADAATLGYPFEPRRDVNTVAVDIVAIDNDIAEIDPDAEFDSAVRWHFGVALDHPALNLDCALHGIDHAWEFDQYAVARRLDDSAAIRCDPGVNMPKRLPTTIRRSRCYPSILPRSPVGA